MSTLYPVRTGQWYRTIEARVRSMLLPGTTVYVYGEVVRITVSKFILKETMQRLARWFPKCLYGKPRVTVATTLRPEVTITIRQDETERLSILASARSRAASIAARTRARKRIAAANAAKTGAKAAVEAAVASICAHP